MEYTGIQDADGRDSRIEGDWTIPNANVRAGSLVRIRESDAPEFTARVVEIQDDPIFGASFKILRPGRVARWISEARIVAVKV